jgi:hypothetical protein
LGNLTAVHYVADEFSLSRGMNFVRMSLPRRLCRELLDAFMQIAFEDQIGPRPTGVFGRLTFDGRQLPQNRMGIEIDLYSAMGQSDESPGASPESNRPMSRVPISARLLTWAIEHIGFGSFTAESEQ